MNEGSTEDASTEPEPIVEVSFAGSDYQRIPIDNANLHGTIMPVVKWVGDGPLICWGTAFPITQSGLFVTARHVVDTFLERYGSATHDGSAGLFVLWESTRPLPSLPDEPDVPATVGGLLPVRGVAQHKTADIALLRVAVPDLADSVQFPRLRLDVGLPGQGRSCIAVGYDRMNLSGNIPVGGSPDGSRIAVDYVRQLAFARGEILDVYPEKRDSGLLWWPSIQTTGRYPGGMSGGPVIGENGFVVGVVSTSDAIAASPDDGEFTSAASLLISLLTMRAPRVEEGETPPSVGELMEADAISVSGLEDIEIDGDAVGFTSAAIDRALEP